MQPQPRPQWGGGEEEQQREKEGQVENHKEKLCCGLSLENREGAGAWLVGTNLRSWILISTWIVNMEN